MVWGKTSLHPPLSTTHPPQDASSSVAGAEVSNNPAGIARQQPVLGRAPSAPISAMNSGVNSLRAPLPLRAQATGTAAPRSLWHHREVVRPQYFLFLPPLLPHQILNSLRWGHQKGFRLSAVSWLRA
jgi:hypothetical protein